MAKGGEFTFIYFQVGHDLNLFLLLKKTRVIYIGSGIFGLNLLDYVLPVKPSIIVSL